MITKYNDIDVSEELFNKNISRLTNQLWKLIPMYENNEDWQKQLNTVILELLGLNEIFISNVGFIQLLSKLEGIPQFEGMSFNFYRKTVFEAISLLQNLKQ